MNKLPEELIGIILSFCVLNCRGQKNLILPLRLVSRSFKEFLTPLIFKTIQLEFSKFLTKSEDVPQIDSLTDVGKHCQALYCDMMVIRDEEEIERLLTVFQSVVQSVPEMTTLLHSLREFCMSKDTFDENDYTRVMAEVLSSAPNLTRLKLNLPFQVIGRASRTATLLLASTFASFSTASSDHRPLEVLVLDHVSDSTIYDICNNPADLQNARASFASLKSLTMSIKRQETSLTLQQRFCYYLWSLICHARSLESLCLIGWNTKRSPHNRVEALDRSMMPDEWQMKSLPYPMPGHKLVNGLKNLRYLELKRVDIYPELFVCMIDENSHSLKELYLNEVHLKIRGLARRDTLDLWIGHAPEQTRPQNSIWIAEYLREKESLQLDILRATSLGYDDFSAVDDQVHPPQQVERYDLEDPSENNRSFDLRFVERAMGFSPPPPQTPIPTTTTQDSSSSHPPPPLTTSPTPPLPKHLYEVEAYQRTPYPYRPPKPTSTNPFHHPSSSSHPPTQVQTERHASCKVLTEKELLHRRDNNTTSQFKRSIDGIFNNHNERALAELQKIIGVVDRSMALLSEEIERIAGEAGRG